MTDIEILEKRWAELASKPKTKEEIEETLLLAKQIELERAKEYKGLIDELADLDIKINYIWDLVNTKSKYPKAIPVLMKYLPLVSYVRNKEGIVRALTVPEAKGLLVPLLVKEYLQLPIDKENLRWVIGNAVNATITESEVANIFPIVLNKENGLSRQMFVTALGKIKTDNVKSVLLQLSNDDDKVIRDEANKALKKVS
jgi:HEAT repeat protein